MRYKDWQADLELKMIPVDQLQIDHEYQRSNHEKHISKIAAEFDYHDFSVLVVSRRGARYYVIDGQQRAAAAVVKGIKRVPCVVVKKLDSKQEAQHFIAINSKRKRVTAIETFNAKVHSGDPDANEIHKIVSNAGLFLRRDNNPTSIVCVGALEKVYLRYGSLVLRDTLHILQDVWPDQLEAMRNEMVFGMAMVVASGSFDFTSNAVKSRLQEKSAIEMIHICKAAKFRLSIDIVNAVAHSITTLLRKLKTAGVKSRVPRKVAKKIPTRARVKSSARKSASKRKSTAGV